MYEGEYQDPGSRSPGPPTGLGMDPASPIARGGTGRKRGRPKGSGRGRAATAAVKGSSPSQSPSPIPSVNNKII